MMQPRSVVRLYVLSFLICSHATGPNPACGQVRGTYDPVLYDSMKWRNIGPFRGGRAVAVAGVRSDPLTYYFGSVGGGVWKTSSAGETWVNVSDGFFRTASVGAISVSPSNPAVVYVGMGEHAIKGVATSHGDGVYRSVDAGKTWKHMGLDRTRHISRIVIHPKNPDLIYCAAQGAAFGASPERGIYRSADGGRSWTLVLHVSKSAGASDLSMDPDNPRILFAALWDHVRRPWEVVSGGPGSGIYRSADGGETWQQLTKDLPDLIGKVRLDTAANSDRVYAMVEADPDGGLFRSDDGGDSWQKLNDGWNIRARAWYFMHVRADPEDPNVVWVMNAALMKSSDGGKTFATVSTPHVDNHDLWINPDRSSTMINANDGGANVSFDGGGTWSTQFNQPTGQFYRVNTDNRFPYHVYAAQQDSATVAIASWNNRAGIDAADQYRVGGCESGHIAFDPDDPMLVYSGCYMGIITEYDVETRRARNIMAYPKVPAGLGVRDWKYRFNWNAPILVSRHDTGVIYHAAQVLLKTKDRGLTWQRISPDLTRNDRRKQGPGGRPITNEAVGAEIYNTILSVAESPHDSRTIWVGSDDGLVHLTRNQGKSWEDVTPEGVGEALINSIEASPHDPATAYLAVSRYKFNDFTPAAFRTRDYGKSWEGIVRGIEEEAWVRVVREDPVRPGLLYAGTETGIYVSFDAGNTWQSLQLNLPVTPVTDLRVQDNDLVASAQGRALWILDNLSPLQQLDERIRRAEVHLYAPEQHYFGSLGASDSAQPRLGQNPPTGALIDYYVGRDRSEATLEIRDAEGAMVRRYSSRGNRDGTSISNRQGMHRIVWDLRHEGLFAVPGLFVVGASNLPTAGDLHPGTLRGRLALPGSYHLRLTIGDNSDTEALELRADPRSAATIESLRIQDQLMSAIDRELEEIHRSVIRIRDVRGQLEKLSARIKGPPELEVVDSAARDLAKKLSAVEGLLVQDRITTLQSTINFPNRLNFHYIYLRNVIDAAEGAVTEGQRQVFADLSAEWSRHKANLDDLLATKLDALNDLVRREGIPAVVDPSKG